jgi:hypothetical protein
MVRLSKRLQLISVLFIAIAILSILYYFIIHYRQTVDGFSPSQGNVPKQIWTYWNDENTIPETVRLCMKSWKKHNPDYKITLLTKKNYKDHVAIPKEIANHANMNDMKQRFADLVRVYVVAEHGGVWVDSSTLMNKSLDSWLYSDKRDADLYGFTIDLAPTKKRFPILENWFFAAPPQSPFVIAWRDEFSNLTKHANPNKYVESVEKLGVDVKDWVVSNTYLAQHVAAQKVIQHDKYPLSKLALLNAGDGPYKYLTKNDWDSRKGLVNACSDPEIRNPFMKLRGGERAIFEVGFETDFSNEKCRWI